MATKMSMLTLAKKLQNNIRDSVALASNDVRAAFPRRAASVTTSSMDRNVVLPSAICLKRLVHVYFIDGRATPLKYAPVITLANATPLLLALYKIPTLPLCGPALRHHEFHRLETRLMTAVNKAIIEDGSSQLWRAYKEDYESYIKFKTVIIISLLRCFCV
jgi:hypothetical protein